MSDQQEEVTKPADRALELGGAAARAPMTLPAYAGYSADADEGEGVHLRDYWRAVRKRLWLVAGVVVCVALLAAVYLARQPDVFVAQARVAGRSGDGRGLARRGEEPVCRHQQSRQRPDYLHTQLQILTSPGCCAGSPRRLTRTQTVLPQPSARAEGAPPCADAARSRFVQSASEVQDDTTDDSAADDLRGDGRLARRLGRGTSGAPYVGALQVAARRAGQGESHGRLRQGHAAHRHLLPPRRPAGGRQDRQRRRRHLRPRQSGEEDRDQHHDGLFPPASRGRTPEQDSHGRGAARQLRAQSPDTLARRRAEHRRRAARRTQPPTPRSRERAQDGRGRLPRCLRAKAADAMPRPAAATSATRSPSSTSCGSGAHSSPRSFRKSTRR